MTNYTDKSLGLADKAIDGIDRLREQRDHWKHEAANKGAWRDAAKVNQQKIEQLKAELATYKREVNNLRGKLAEL